MQHDTRPALPEPDAASAAHSARVAEYIRGLIAESGGSLSFAEFMQQALYAPALGYYTAGSVKFGREGDFVTAPEVSPIFGRVVARQCAEVLRELHDGSILEFGAGSGRLASDILQSLERLDALPARYEIVEISGDLQERQARLLETEVPHLLPRIAWLSAPPEDHEGVIIANEVLDALPVERFKINARNVGQARVRVEETGFSLAYSPAPEILASAVLEIENELGARLPDGYVSEVSLGLRDWVSTVAASLKRGLILLFDYGVSRGEYYAQERSAGWLRCHFRHHAHNEPLILVGIQDMSAWVDFNAVAEAAEQSGLDVAGYAAQAQFLIGGGLEAEMQDFASLPLQRQLELSAQVKTLTLPAEMGERFKCMALRRGAISIPSAFKFTDRTHTL